MCCTSTFVWRESKWKMQAQCDTDKVLFIRAGGWWIRVQHPRATSTAQAYFFMMVAVNSFSKCPSPS